MKTAKVIFYLKADKEKKDSGEQPIYCRITVDGKRVNISINRWVDPVRWKDTNKLQNARNTKDKELNFYMESIRSRIKEIERELLDSRTLITSENIKNVFTGKVKKSKTLIEGFDCFIAKYEVLVENKNKSRETLEKYIRFKKHLKTFMKLKYNKSDFYMEEIDENFIDEFDLYLRSERIDEDGKSHKCNNNSTVKYISNLRTIILEAIRKKWIKNDVCANYQGKLEEVDRVFLTPEEIDRLENKQFGTDRLNVLRDVFMFSVYTGYAYKDVKDLTYSQLQQMDKRLWVFKRRQKSKTKSNQMILYPALDLIDKYRNHPKCKAKGVLFPVISNQKSNEYLKEIADLCGISKILTTHVARHTYATSIMLLNGAPLETVRKTMGHRHQSQTEHYGEILDMKVLADLEDVEMKLRLKKDIKKQV